MKRVVIIMLWISVLVVGAGLRWEQLAKRPMHADEATGARIAARRMESGIGQFDPKHFHGPLLADLAIPWCRWHGENRWQDLTKTTLRTLPVIAGILLLGVPLLWRRRFGDGPMLLAAALLATSPLLVYYSRMFIHESLLVLFGMLAVLALTRQPRWGIPGVLIGLMFATKESFAISVIAWTTAGLLLAWENRHHLDRQMMIAGWRQYRVPVVASLLTAAITAGWFYTDGFRHAHGAIDAVRTFFVYETGSGHDKPWNYYLKFLMLPKKSGGVWWFETPVLILALLAYASTFRRNPQPVANRAIIRFIAYAAVGHFVIYSLIAYKTPWLACLPWAHVCLLAGCALAGFASHRLPVRITLAMVVAGGLVTQFYQTRRATGRYAADERNPYAYVPTSGDIEKLPLWFEQLRKVTAANELEPVGVVGNQYWPLPWYLRSFEHIGYWPQPPPDLAKLPVVLALPDTAAAVTSLLTSTHVQLPRGLRSGVPVQLFMRNDIYKQWMDSASR